MAATATLNSTHLLFQQGGADVSRITAGAQHIRLEGASSEKLSIRNLADGVNADDAASYGQVQSAITAAASANASLSASITAAYEAADSALNTAISGEASARATEKAAHEAARANLQSSINTNAAAVSAEAVTRAAQDAATLSSAQNYADAAVAVESSARVSGDSAAVASAATYTDTQVAAASVADRAYADAAVSSMAQGVSWKDACDLYAGAALPACVHDGTALTLTGSANGALTVDSVACATGMRILVNKQLDQKQNGIFVVTSSGGAGAPFVLTRADDANTTEKMQSCAVFIMQGSSAEQAYVLSTDGYVLNEVCSFVIFGSPGQYVGQGAISISAAKEVSIVDGGVTRAMLQADCIDGTRVADDAIDTEHLVDDCIQAAQLDAGCVGDAACAFVNVAASTVTASGQISGQSYLATSDERKKMDIEDLSEEECTEQVKKFRTCSYRFKETPLDGPRYGTIAQSLQESDMGHLVRQDEQGDLAVNYIDYIAIMSSAMRRLIRRVEELESK